MQIYRVKLKKDHVAEPDQVSKDGYLADENGQPYLYKPNPARSKAKDFGGETEKFGKNYQTSEVKMIQFDQTFLNPLTIELLKERAVYKYQGGLDMFICYGNIFDELLEENTPKEILDELRILSVLCVDIDYVHIL